jgi:heme-degrading monooxygenase HmoA
MRSTASPHHKLPAREATADTPFCGVHRIRWNYNPEERAMALSVIQHKVADFDAWHQVYDSVADLQAAGGVAQQSFHRKADDPDTVLVLHYFDSVDQAQAFFASPELQDAMKRGGVVGEPRIEFYE